MLWGSWRIGHVLNNAGEVVEAKLTVEHIQRQCPQPNGFNSKALKSPKVFLCSVQEGHRVVVSFGGALHIGTVGNGYLDGPPADSGEIFKSRPIIDQKTFPLGDLPAGFRLLNTTGRATIQPIKTFKNHVQFLDRYPSAQEVRQAFMNLNIHELLGMLSAAQWEVLCEEFLRSTINMRSLLLKTGHTLKSNDIIGVDLQQRRVMAQCKNSSDPWPVLDVESWTYAAASRAGDRLFFFCRGGVNGKIKNPTCTVVDGETVAAWLEKDANYLKALKTL